MGGVQRGTHVLKALSLGAKAVGLGRYYLFQLAVAGDGKAEYLASLPSAEMDRLPGRDGVRRPYNNWLYAGSYYALPS